MANRFCGADGVILKLVPSPSSNDKYFNVEWLSDFDHEKERLFAFAENIRIGDIHYFQGQTLHKNGQYLAAFLLFSSLFSGHFVLPLLGLNSKKKRLMKPWKILHDLIVVYKATNRITENVDDALNIKIPLYIQQLFYQLLEGFKKNREMKLVIESEIDLLDESLKRELVVDHNNLDDQDNHKLTLSPFMRTLCVTEDITVMEKYLWIIDDEQFRELKNKKSTIYSEVYYYNVPDAGKVSFALRLGRQSAGSSSIGIGIWIKETLFPVDGRWSLMIDEVQYTRNDIRFFRKGNAGYFGKFAFEDTLMNTVERLTVTFALFLTPSS